MFKAKLKILKNKRHINFICAILLILFYPFVYGQNRADSLKLLLKENCTDSVRLRLLFETGYQEYIDYQNDSAIYYFNEALKIAGKSGDAKTEAEVNYYLGELFAYTGDYDLALEHYFRGIDYYSAYNDAAGLNNCYFGAGLVYKYKAYFNVSRTYYELSLQICLEMNDTLGLADVYNNLGTVEKNLGNYPRAMDYFSRVLEIAQSQKLEIHEVNALNNIAQIHDLQGAPEKGLEYYKQSLNLARKINNKFYLFVPMVNLASAHALTGEPGKALDLFNEALVLANVTNDISRVAYCYTELGKLMVQTGNFTKAAEYYNQAFQIAGKTGNLSLKGEVFLSLSQLEVIRKNYNLAHQYAVNALNLSDSTQALPDKATAYKQLYEVATVREKYEEGLIFHKNWIALKDSLYSIEKAKAIEELEIQYQVKAKTEENERLKYEAGILQQILKQRKKVTLLLGAGILLSLLVVTLLIIQIKNRKKLHLQEDAISRQKLENLKNKIEYQKRELVTKSMFIAEKNSLVERIINQLAAISVNGTGNSTQLKSLIRELNFDLKNQKHWKEFEAHFNEVHPGFYKKLNEKHPGLTVNERKLAAFLKMKLSTKDVSGITGQSIKSIEVARTRLRKKLGMAHGDNLYNVLERI